MSNTPIPLLEIQAVIFDMDELMINSDGIYWKVFDMVLVKYGVSLKDPKNPLTKNEMAGWYGRKVIDFFAFLREKYHLADRVSTEQLNEEFNETLLPIFRDEIEAMPGLIDLTNYLKGKYKFAIASSAIREKIDIVLRKFSLVDMFEVIVSGEDEEFRSKPAPDIYLAAARRLGIDPKNCLVLEDAKNGVESAKNAGMYCIGVHNKFTFEIIGLKQDLSHADIKVESLLEVIPILNKQK